MRYFIYLLISTSKKKLISYVGYTTDIKNRLKMHNMSKGAKFTRGREWILIYKKEYKSKSEALKQEYKLKKDYKKRNIIKTNFLKKNENINLTSL
jgi:putative endonuclease